MATVTDSTQTTDSEQSPELARRVAEIISRGQRTRPGAAATLLLSLLTGLLLWASFTPLDWGPLAWIGLVPLLSLVRPAARTRWMYRIVYVSGFCYWLATLQWMRLGDTTMYVALFALALYLAAYWPLFLGLCRVAVHRLHVPLVLAAPVFWVGLEYIRSHLFTGFAWYLLGHSQYRWVDVIQIADLGGAYAITFLLVMANAAAAQLIPDRFISKWNLCWPGERDTLAHWTTRQKWTGCLAASLLVVVACGYGMLRRSGGAFPLGPRVALIQGNFVASAHGTLDDPRDVFMLHRQLTGLTVAEQPDLVVWPEAMFPYGLYDVSPGMTDEQLEEIAPEVPISVWREGASQKALADIADMTNAALVIGVTTFVAHPAAYSLYNSAVFMQPGVSITNRYDKIHRVPFGEYIPLQQFFPYLQSLTPYRGKFGIDKGEQGHVFRWKDWQLIPIICFEDTVPHLVRKIAKAAKVNSGEQTQVLVNLTNDGWFHGSSELNQHLITSQFRAIENRMPLVRAVNTGISAVIDGDGVVREAVKFLDASLPDENQPRRTSMRDPRTGQLHKQLSCAVVADVPLDPRTSLYVAWGDWFAAICLSLTLLVGVSSRFVKPLAAPAGPSP